VSVSLTALQTLRTAINRRILPAAPQKSATLTAEAERTYTLRKNGLGIGILKVFSLSINGFLAIWKTLLMV